MSQSYVTWSPTSQADRELVLQELRNILASHPFRNSKRYPALLRYLVEHAVEGLNNDLKERVQGWENRNIEMVVETDIINGDPAPPKLRAVEVW